MRFACRVLAATMILRILPTTRLTVALTVALLAAAICALVLMRAKERHTQRMEALDVLKLQLDDLSRGSTKVAYQLASPANRRSTASGGGGGSHNAAAFDRMVRADFAPMLEADDYLIFPETQGENAAAYDVVLFASAEPTTAYRFELSRTRERCGRDLGPYAAPRQPLLAHRLGYAAHAHAARSDHRGRKGPAAARAPKDVFWTQRGRPFSSA